MIFGLLQTPKTYIATKDTSPPPEQGRCRSLCWTSPCSPRLGVANIMPYCRLTLTPRRLRSCDDRQNQHPDPVPSKTGRGDGMHGCGPRRASRHIHSRLHPLVPCSETRSRATRVRNGQRAPTVDRGLRRSTCGVSCDTSGRSASQCAMRIRTAAAIGYVEL